MRAIIVSLVLAGVAVTAVTADASAQGRRRVVRVASNDIQSLPLTVNRRSWLDPGNATSSSGANGPAYVTSTTAEFARPATHYYQPDNLGGAALPGQPYVPGRTVPVVSFSSNRDGTADIDNVLHYQPY